MRPDPNFGQPVARPVPMSTRARRAAAALGIATALAVPAEGLRQVAYRDPVGIPTVCFGATKGVKMGDTHTVAECKALLDRDMLAAIATVDACHPGLPVPVLAAFADATYNMGPTIACDPTRSTAARLLRAMDFAGACRQLPRWNKARVAGVIVELPGLTKRRAEEMRVCLEGV